MNYKFLHYRIDLMKSKLESDLKDPPLSLDPLKNRTGILFFQLLRIMKQIDKRTPLVSFIGPRIQSKPRPDQARPDQIQSKSKTQPRSKG